MRYIILQIFGASLGLFLAKKKQEPVIFWLSIVPVIGPAFAVFLSVMFTLQYIVNRFIMRHIEGFNNWIQK